MFFGGTNEGATHGGRIPDPSAGCPSLCRSYTVKAFGLALLFCGLASGFAGLGAAVAVAPAPDFAALGAFITFTHGASFTFGEQHICGKPHS